MPHDSAMAKQQRPSSSVGHAIGEWESPANLVPLEGRGRLCESSHAGQWPAIPMLGCRWRRKPSPRRSEGPSRHSRLSIVPGNPVGLGRSRLKSGNRAQLAPLLRHAPLDLEVRQAAPRISRSAAARASSVTIAPASMRATSSRGDLVGRHSIRINDQWRILFRWSNEGPEEVEIVDYH